MSPLIRVTGGGLWEIRGVLGRGWLLYICYLGLQHVTLDPNDWRWVVGSQGCAGKGVGFVDLLFRLATCHP